VIRDPGHPDTDHGEVGPNQAVTTVTACHTGGAKSDRHKRHPAASQVGPLQAALLGPNQAVIANEVAEITLLAGTYVLCATFLKSLHVPLDDGPVDWTAADAYTKEVGL
jgi:hypothetical protein